MSNDNGQSGHGGRLRWWQEENTTRQPSESRWYSQSAALKQEIAADSTPLGQCPAVLPEPLDIGEELEAEARRRVELERQAIVIEGNVDQIFKRKRQLITWILLPALAMQLWAFAVTHDPFLLFFFALLLAEATLLPIWMKKLWQKDPPRLSISPLGLNIQTPFYRIGPVFWNEIRSVRVKKVLFLRYLQIDLNDQKAIYHRAFRSAGKASWTNRMNAWIYRFYPIQLDESFFPVSLEAIAAKIATYTGGQSDGK